MIRLNLGYPIRQPGRGLPGGTEGVPWVSRGVLQSFTHQAITEMLGKFAFGTKRWGVPPARLGPIKILKRGTQWEGVELHVTCVL